MPKRFKSTDLVAVVDNTDGRVVSHTPYDRANVFCAIHNTLGNIRYSIKSLEHPKVRKRKGFMGGYRQIGAIVASRIKEEIKNRPEHHGKYIGIARDLDVSEKVVRDIYYGRRWKNA